MHRLMLDMGGGSGTHARGGFAAGAEEDLEEISRRIICRHEVCSASNGRRKI
jgi:hypothetical protein